MIWLLRQNLLLANPIRSFCFVYTQKAFFFVFIFIFRKELTERNERENKRKYTNNQEQTF